MERHKRSGKVERREGKGGSRGNSKRESEKGSSSVVSSTRATQLKQHEPPPGQATAGLIVHQMPAHQHQAHQVRRWTVPLAPKGALQIGNWVPAVVDQAEMVSGLTPRGTELGDEPCFCCALTTADHAL